MKLTPLDIRHKEFKRGMRGYVDSEVAEFLDDIADEFERLFRENIELGEKAEALEEKIAQYHLIEETLQKTLVSAQQSADELKQNATKESQLILRDAELKARQMLNESYADKQRIEKEIAVLKNTGDEFRFRFRSMLESYVGQVGELDRGAKHDAGDQQRAGERAGDFQRQADALKEAIAREDAAAAKPPEASAGPEPSESDNAASTALRDVLAKLGNKPLADETKLTAVPELPEFDDPPPPSLGAESPRDADGPTQRVPVEWHVTSGETDEDTLSAQPEPPEHARFTIDDVLADYDIDGDESK